MDINYEQMTGAVAVLGLPQSSSALHGMLCAYIVMHQEQMAESYVVALIPNHKNESIRVAARLMFKWLNGIKRDLDSEQLSFDLFLPQEDHPLCERAQAFSQWCEGYLYVLKLLGISESSFYDQDTKDALLHLSEFSELDYDKINVSADDEQSFFEVCEYTRVAVFHMYHDIRFEQLNDISDRDSLH